MGAAGPVLVLVCQERPHSWNKGTALDSYARFGGELARAFDDAGHPGFGGLLYGVIYWFVRGYDERRHPDADNISKPVWDMLSTRRAGVPTHEIRLGAYGDDKQVRLRVAGIVDLPPVLPGPDTPEADQIILPSMPEEVAEQLDGFIADGRLQHFVYVECGPLRPGVSVSGLLGGRS